MADLVDDAFNHHGNQHFVDFGYVNQEIVELVKEQTGRDVSRYVHSITGADIRHIINRHGPSTSTDASVLEVTTDDIKRIPELLAKADSVASAVDSNGRPGLEYTIIENDRITVIQTFSHPREKLQVKSMWKSKVSKNRPPAK